MRDQMEAIEKGGASAFDPTERARERMRKPLPKRFYEEATVGEKEGEAGYSVLLDGRVVKTPGRKILAFPTRPIAQLIADEFAAQEEVLDPALMPVFRLANSAVEGVAENKPAVADDLLQFAGSDLLCYRAEGPEGLVQAQRAMWDPVLNWVYAETGARFETTGGIMFADQPGEALAAFAFYLKRFDDHFQLAALHSMTTLTGSVFLALGVAKEQTEPEEAWSAAHVDEDWNIAQWGEDYEARARREQRWTEMKAAADLFRAAAQA